MARAILFKGSPLMKSLTLLVQSKVTGGLERHLPELMVTAVQKTLRRHPEGRSVGLISQVLIRMCRC